MGPPGGGRNDITGRFTRHLQVISIDEFDDNTMTRIFTNISDWHFGKGFEPAFSRLGKVRLTEYFLGCNEIFLTMPINVKYNVVLTLTINLLFRLWSRPLLRFTKKL